MEELYDRLDEAEKRIGELETLLRDFFFSCRWATSLEAVTGYAEMALNDLVER